MGVWEWIYSATDCVKQNAPDISPVTEACRKGYDAGRATTTQVDGFVRTKGREIHQYLSDDQVRANVTRIATNVSKNGAVYLARYYGGGPVIDVVTWSLQDRKVDSRKDRIQELESRVAKLEMELNTLKTPEQVQIPTLSMPSKAGDESDFNATLNQPEDLIRTFMMKQSIGRKLLADLIVPGTGSTWKEKPISSVNGQYE